jgi:hypothetical protein
VRVFTVNAAKGVAKIPVTGGKRNTFAQLNFNSYSLEDLNQFVSDYLTVFSKCSVQFTLDFVI